MGKSIVVRRIGYLGPEGTFTHQAIERLRHAPVSGGVRAVPFATVMDVIGAVEGGRVDGGVVPIENSIEGAVTATLDGLAFGRGGVRIAAEVLLPIHFDLFVSRGMKGARLREVLSHPHAFAQCRNFIGQRRLVTRSALSTADACQTLRDDPRAGVGAIASSKTGAMYGLAAVWRGIEDVKDAVTRFVFLAKRTPARTWADKTSLVLTPKHNRPGSLMEVLREFSSRRINLSRIESRPLKTKLGRYCFFIDAEGHIDDPLLSDAVLSLSRKDVDVKFLGSYPRAGVPVAREGGIRPAAAKKGTIRSVGICGLGLIGGSLAQALRSLGGVSVKGYDIEGRTRREAGKAGIDCVSSLADAVSGVDLIVVATPIESIESVLGQIAPMLKRGQIVTDVGSVKVPLMRAARRLMPSWAIFIGGHPMAGSERSGFGSSRTDLFRGATWVLTADKGTNPRAFSRLSDLIHRLDARVTAIRAEAHDSAVSLISHLPHVLAYSLMAYAAESGDRSIHQDLAAGSFRDMVRVAGSPPKIWAEICRRNSENIHSTLKEYLSRLAAVESLMARGDFEGLRALFEDGYRGYRKISG